MQILFAGGKRSSRKIHSYHIAFEPGPLRLRREILWHQEGRSMGQLEKQLSACEDRLECNETPRSFSQTFYKHLSYIVQYFL